MQIAAVANSERDPDDPIATWTYIEASEVMNQAGIEVSVSQVWRILRAMDIDLPKVRGWLNRRENPGFWERVCDVGGMYLHPPEHALVLTVDEKTSVKAKSLIATSRRVQADGGQPGAH